MYNQQLQRSFNRINNIKLLRPNSLRDIDFKNNTYNIIFVATVLFYLLCFVDQEEVKHFYCDYDDTHHIIYTLTFFFFQKKNIRVQVCDRCDAKRLLQFFNEMF